MERIAQVEQKIISENGNDAEMAERILWPSQYLMKHYSPMSAEIESLSLCKTDLIQDVTSPDISDLQKRFDKIMCNTNSGQNDSEEEEKGVELPEHLQLLVDQALAQMD